MNLQKQWESVKGFCRKVGKRNWIILGALVLIGAAVWLNFALFDRANGDGGYDYSTPGGMTGAGDQLDGETTPVDEEGEDGYFSAVQVSRQRARDEALEVLQSVVDNESADDAAKTQALTQIAQLAAEMDQESNIETLILAKGFSACVAVINDGAASVVVEADGLLASQIAQINEIVYEQAGIKPENITIIER